MSQISEDRVSDRGPASSGVVNRMLASLPDEDQHRMSAHLTAVPMRFKDILYKQNQRIEYVYFPGSGACSLTKCMANGQVAEIATIGSEGVIGASVFFGDELSFSEVIVQVGEGGGFRMPVEAFMLEMTRHGAFYNRVIRYYQALMSQIMQTTVCNGLHTVEQRCCRWLLMTDDRVERTDMRLTHEFISIMLGVRRPTVTLVMNDLQKAGLISNERGVINIIDRPGLENTSCECYETVKATFARLLPEIPAVS